MMTAQGEVAPPTRGRGRRHPRPPNGAARRSHGGVATGDVTIGLCYFEVSLLMRYRHVILS
jgi:hypothetical protein